MESRRELHGTRLVECYAARPENVLAHLDRVFYSRGNSLALVDRDERIEYLVLDRQARALAGLFMRHGVRQGDRVAVMIGNCADAIRTILAVARLGAIIVPIGTRSRAPEIAHIVSDAQVSLLVYAAEFRPELTSQCPQLIEVGSADWRSALVADAPALPEPVIGEEDVFAILYTSGTTGRPKGAMLTHLNVIHSCMHWIEAHALGAEERTMLCVPWAHVSGLCGVVMPFLYAGAKIVILPEFKRREALELAAREKITHALMVPAMYGLCLLEPDLASFDLGSWRIAAYGGAIMPEPTIARFSEVFPQLAMCNCYGATETCSPATIMPPGEGTRRLDSIGKVVRCGEIRVLDEQGHEVPPGEDGELWIAGPMVVPGYWRNEAATEASFVAGFWKSGDIGSIDAEGFVRIADRKKDMIIRGGFKVYPAEVENVLTAMTGVVEAAVVGQQDEILGENVIAFLNVADPAIDAAQVRAFCASRLSDYKVPSIVLVSDAPLPRNANGKIQKAELRERAATLPVGVRS